MTMPAWIDPDTGDTTAEPPVIIGSQGEKRIMDAIKMIVQFGGTDGAHHKDWVLDQTVRILAGDSYSDVVGWAKHGEDGPDTYGWDEGIAP